MKQICVVTGGAGFIGSHLIDKLSAQNYAIICLDNLSSGNRQNINKRLNTPDFTFIRTDLSKSLSPQVKAALLKAAYIFHLASPASPNSNSKYSYLNQPVNTLMVNSFGTYQLLDLIRSSRAKFLYTSTSEIYGDPAQHPQKETYWGNVNPVGIRSCYDEAKRFGEAVTFAYIRKYAVDARVVRVFNTYGPRMQRDDGRAVIEFISHALKNTALPIFGTGKQTRSFCYIDDMAGAIVAAMFKKRSIHQVINIGNPAEISILDLAHLIIDLTKSSSKINFRDLPADDPHQRKPDISRARKLLDWEPKISLSEGLTKTIASLRS